MATQRTPVVRVPEGTRITARTAAAAWAVAWLAGMVLSAIVVGASGQARRDAPVWLIVVGTIAMWIPMLVVLREVSQRHGVHDVVAEYGLRFRAIDAAGSRSARCRSWSSFRWCTGRCRRCGPTRSRPTSSNERARDLYDSADGGWIVALVVVVVVGAPLVEELLYRGLLQGAFARRVESWVAVVVVAAWFAIIHFAPVELPGPVRVRPRARRVRARHPSARPRDRHAHGVQRHRPPARRQPVTTAAPNGPLT